MRKVQAWEAHEEEGGARGQYSMASEAASPCAVCGGRLQESVDGFLLVFWSEDAGSQAVRGLGPMNFALRAKGSVRRCYYMANPFTARVLQHAKVACHFASCCCSCVA